MTPAFSPLSFHPGGLRKSDPSSTTVPLPRVTGSVAPGTRRRARLHARLYTHDRPPAPPDRGLALGRRVRPVHVRAGRGGSDGDRRRPRADGRLRRPRRRGPSAEGTCLRPPLDAVLIMAAARLRRVRQRVAAGSATGRRSPAGQRARAARAWAPSAWRSARRPSCRCALGRRAVEGRWQQGPPCLRPAW